MDVISEILGWLERNEGALSAMAALVAISAVAYAAFVTIFPSVGRRARRLFDRDGEDGPSAASPKSKRKLASPARSSPGVPKASIAVLPLKPLSANEDDLYMAQGISSEIIADLAKVPELRVASHVASFAFQGDTVDLQEVADVLSIRYVLTGNFQRQGDRMHAMVELTDALEQEQLWAATYDRNVEDLFAVQEEVAIAIVSEIGGELKLADAKIADSSPTKSLDAWGLVQKAFAFWLTTFDKQGYDDSQALLTRAVKIDPNYAAARASLGMIMSQRVINGLSEDFEKDRSNCLSMVEKAMQLDPRDLTVLENAGLVWTHHGYGERGREALRRAVELAPLDLIAWGYLAFNLGWTGTEEDVSEAIDILDRLFAMAPRHPSGPYWNYFRSTAYCRLGNIEEGIQAGLDSVAAQPGFYLSLNNLANLYGIQGDIEQARAMWSKAEAINPSMTPAVYLIGARTLCSSEEQSETFVHGLRIAGILVDDEASLPS
ncbi:MAG: tetratricopeptide repeat protein [Woeseiaceae bacterium]